jgi:hypothetical protein
MRWKSVLLIRRREGDVELVREEIRYEGFVGLGRVKRGEHRSREPSLQRRTLCFSPELCCRMCRPMLELPLLFLGGRDVRSEFECERVEGG